jgi:gliding motility-associated-like protein
LPDAVTIEFGDSVLLLPVLNLPVTGVATWAWTPADGLSCTNCPSPYAQPARSTVYQVNITDLNGCKAESRVRVLIDLRRKVYAPNVFVPGQSGPNAFFNLYGKGVAGIPLLEIFDRWGNQLYLGENLPVNDEFSGWDGVYRGQPVAPGVYVWQAKVLFTDGEELLLSGDVTVMR